MLPLAFGVSGTLQRGFQQPLQGIPFWRIWPSVLLRSRPPTTAGSGRLWAGSVCSRSRSLSRPPGLSTGASGNFPVFYLPELKPQSGAGRTWSPFPRPATRQPRGRGACALPERSCAIAKPEAAFPRRLPTSSPAAADSLVPPAGDLLALPIWFQHNLRRLATRRRKAQRHRGREGRTRNGTSGLAGTSGSSVRPPKNKATFKKPMSLALYGDLEARPAGK